MRRPGCAEAGGVDAGCYGVRCTGSSERTGTRGFGEQGVGRHGGVGCCSALPSAGGKGGLGGAGCVGLRAEREDTGGRRLRGGDEGLRVSLEHRR